MFRALRFYAIAEVGAMAGTQEVKHRRLLADISLQQSGTNPASCNSNPCRFPSAIATQQSGMRPASCNSNPCHFHSELSFLALA